MKWKYYKFTTLRRVVDRKAQIKRELCDRFKREHPCLKVTGEINEERHLYLSYLLEGVKGYCALSEYLYERERRSYKEFRKLGYWGRIKYFLR